MTDRIQNQLNSVGASITVAHSPEHKNTWHGKEPEDFGTDLAALEAAYGAVIGKAAQVEAATGGATDAKAAAETALENAAFVLARALASHFRKTGDLDRLGKVDLTKTAIVKLRAQPLVNQATAIRDLAAVAATEPDAAKRGVTAARIATLSAAITNFSKVMNAPRGQIINRSTMIREVETDTANLLDQCSALDDLALQFDGTEAGRRFIEAWKHARIIVDAGHSPAEKTAPTPPPTPLTA